MSDPQVTDYVQKMKSLCAIIQERDAEILKKRLTIKARENENTENKRKIKELRRHEIDWYKEEIKAIQAVCNKQTFIKSWLIQNREVHLEAIFNENKLRYFVSKELISEKEKSVELQAEVTAKAAKARAICLKHFDYKEMKKNSVEALKVQIALKMKLVDLTNVKKRIALKNEIKRKLFYAVFIKLANEYVVEHKWTEYKQMQKNIQALSEKISNSRHKEKRLAKTISFKRKLDQYDFGNQLAPREKPSLFSRDEFKESKIQILENKTIRAPLQPPKPEPPFCKSMPQTQQLINRKSLLLRQWQKIVAKKSDKLNTTQSSQLSQQSQKDLNASKEENKLFQAPAEPQEELVEYELNDSLENQTASQPAITIPVYGSSNKQSILQNFTKNNENNKVSQTKSTASNIFSKGSQKKTGETPKTVRFIMDQPFGQSMFDMSKGATFTLPESTESISVSGEVTAGCTSDMNFELSEYESGVTDVPEFSFAVPEFQQSSASIAPVPFSSSKGFFSLQNQMPFHF